MGRAMAQNSDLSTRGEPVPDHVRASRRQQLKRAVRKFLLFLFVVSALPVALIPLYAVIDPPVTTVMVLKRLGGAPIDMSWRPIEDISPQLVRAVMMGEDARFCAHGGVDWIEMKAALARAEDGGRLRGASTITMQTVKNLFLWNGRSWIRKGLELPLALYADLVLGKRRIMEIYLNIVEWDTGVYGAEAASRNHFGVSARQLSAAQSARLAAILPAPEARDPARPGRRTRELAATIAARAARSGGYVDCVLD